MLQESDIARLIIGPGLFGLPKHSFAQILADFDIAALVLPQAATPVLPQAATPRVGTDLTYLSIPSMTLAKS